MKTGNNDNVDIGLRQVSEWILESVRSLLSCRVPGSLYLVSLSSCGVSGHHRIWLADKGKERGMDSYWVGQKVSLGSKKIKWKHSLANPIHEVLWAGPKSGIHSFHQLRHNYSSVFNLLLLCGQEKDGPWKTSSQHHSILSLGREQHSVWIWGKKLDRAQGPYWSGDEVPHWVWTIEVLLGTRWKAQSTQKDENVESHTVDTEELSVSLGISAATSGNFLYHQRWG